MTVGICTIELYIPEVDSLKGKKRVLKGIKDRIRERFNVSIAELDNEDLWQKSMLGIACIGNGQRYVNQVLDRVINFIRDIPVVEIVRYRFEMI